MQELHIGELSVLQMAGDSIVMALWEIGLRQEIMETLHNKENQLLYANGDPRKKKMLWLLFAGTIYHRSERLPN